VPSTTFSTSGAGRSISIAVLLTLAFASLDASRTRACAVPPGGQVVCESAGDTPACEVQDGRFKEGRCLTPPAGLGPRETQAWILTKITGKPVTLADLDKYREALATGEWRDGGRIVTFSLPDGAR
jgi:hypothetical protein